MHNHTSEVHDSTVAAQYEAPQITDHGTLADLTAATNVGTFTDAALPAHTPIAGHLS